MDGRGIDGGGCDGNIRGDNLTRRELIARREPLRGKRREPKGRISAEEKEEMAQCMKRWLGRAPHKANQN